GQKKVGALGSRGRPARPGGRVAADRLPARAHSRRDLPGQGLPERGEHPARARARRAFGATPQRHAARSARDRLGHPGGGRGVPGREGAGLPASARGGGVRAAGRGRRATAGEAARRSALTLRLVRRRLAHPGDGRHRDRERTRVPCADRPLASAHRGPRALRRATHRPARRRRSRQRAPRREVPAAQGDRGRHPRGRQPRPERGDARPPGGGGRIGALQAPDGRRRDDSTDGGGRPKPGHRRAGPLHGTVDHRRTWDPAAEPVRRRRRLRGLCGARRRRRDQLPARAQRPARRAGRARAGQGLPVLHRQRRARTRAARLPRLRLRPGAAPRRATGAAGQHLAARAPAGVEHWV
ncbi:MAG: DNA-dependent DNA polymerase beta chain, partial [uncultured Nocardioidaceae bacterium]